MAAIKHILWISDHGAPVGGCERYVRETADLLRAEGIRSSLMYQVHGALDADYLKAFDGAYPCVDPELQIQDIAPDFIYVHRLSGVELTRKITAVPIPKARFFHDHKLFCLREHKYTTLGHRTCTRPVGAHCYGCLGFVNRMERWPGVRLHTLGALRREQRANLAFDAFILGSSYMREHIVAHGFPAARAHVVPLYAFPRSPDPSIVRDARLFLIVGQLLRGKGLDYVFEAMRRCQHRDARLLVVGSGRQEAMYRALARKLGVDARIEFIGRMASAELERMMQRATCLLFPSRSPETFGLVGVEAMRFATPVIAMRVGGVTEWLEDGVNGLLVPPGDAQALAEAMDRLMDDEQLRQRLGEGGIQRYRQRFTPQRHVRRLIEVFEQVTEAAC